MERLKKWIKQAQFIESFGPEAIRDVQVREFIYKLQDRLEEVEEDRNRWKETAKKICNFYCCLLSLNKCEDCSRSVEKRGKCIESQLKAFRDYTEANLERQA